MSTSMQSLVTVSVDFPTGTQQLGVFDKRTGGETAVTAAKHRPGGWTTEKSYAVLPTYTDVVVSRVYERDRDHELVRSLINASGRSMVTVVEQPLDPDGHAWGSPITWRGRIGPVKPGDYDSTSSAVRMFDLTVSVETRS